MLNQSIAISVYRFATIFLVLLAVYPEAGATIEPWQQLEVLRPACSPDESACAGWPREVRGSVDQIQIGGIPDSTRVQVELDYDEWPAARVVLRDGVMVIDLGAPLAPGEHRLRLFEDSADAGVILEQADWIFEVLGEATGGDAGSRSTLQINATLDAGWRAAEQGLGDMPRDQLQTEGSLQLAGDVAAGAWGLSADTAVVHSRSRGEIPGQRRTDLNTFLLTGDAGPVNLRLGDQTVEFNFAGSSRSLILESFHRRGLAADLDLGSAGLRLTGFVLTAEPLVGLDAGFGLDDPDDRLDGAVLTQGLLDSDWGRLDVQVAYFDGRGSPGVGVGVAGDPTPASGLARGLAVSGLLFERRLRVHGEVSQTRFDPDGDSGGADARRDHGYSLETAWRSRPRPRSSFSWSVGLRGQRVGTFFRSLGRSSLANDKESLSGTGSIESKRFDLRFRLDREQDNVEQLAALPRIRADVASLAATWRPRARREVGESQGWSRPLAVRLTLRQSDEDTLSAPAQSIAIDRLSRSLHLALNGARWNLGYVRDDFEDARPVGSSSAIRTTHEIVDLSAQLVGERWNLQPMTQWTRLEGLGTGVDQTTVLARVSSYRSLFSDRLIGTLGADLLWLRPTDDSDQRIPTLTADLTWQAVPPRGGHPGLALWARGSYTDTDDQPARSASSSQIFMGARFSWSRTL